MLRPASGADRARAARRRADDRPVELPDPARARSARRRTRRRQRRRGQAQRDGAADVGAAGRAGRRVPRRPASCGWSKVGPTRPPRCWSSASTTSSTPATGGSARIVMAAAAKPPDAGDVGARRQEPGDRARRRRHRLGRPPHRVGQVPQRRARPASPPTTCSSTCSPRTASSAPRCAPCTTSSATSRGSSPDFARIVNDHHFQRVTGLLDAGGYEAIVTGGTRDAATRYLAPTVVAGVSPDCGADGRGDLRAGAPGADGRRQPTRRSSSSTTARSRSPCTCSAATRRRSTA